MMAARKASIYINDRQSAILGNPDSLSGRLALIVERYGEACRRHCPSFTQPEWCLIIDTANGLLQDIGGGDPALTFWGEVADNDRLNRAGENFGCDGQALARRLRDLPYIEQVSVIETAWRYWDSLDRLNALSIADALRELGIAVAQP